MASTTLCIVTPRDRDLFQALDRSPLTVRQLLKLSTTFAYPFTTERRVQERLQRLTTAGRVRRWRYATAGPGALSYYTLSPLGYRLLHGVERLPSGRGRFGPIGVARQAHSHALAETIVHVLVGTAKSLVPIAGFWRENALCLRVGEEHLYPDGTLELRPEPDSKLTYFLEIDNRSETVSVGSSVDTWGRKVQFYEKYQDAQEERFRVVLITTGGQERLKHMLHTAATLARNPQRSLVYGITLVGLLQDDQPLSSPCFRDHRSQLVTLLPRLSPSQHENSLLGDPVMVTSAPCLRLLAEV